jgi:integrase
LIAINLQLLGGPEQKPALSDRAIQLVTLYIFDRIQRKKSRTVRNDFSAICRFDRWLSSRHVPALGNGQFNWSHLDEILARGFLDHGIRNTSDKGNDFSRLRTFYRWGLAHQHRDFRLETAVELKSILAIGNAKGHNVRFRHPIKGPLSPDEKLLVSNACVLGRGNDQDRAMVMLHQELGINPNATARIKNRDLKTYSTNGVSTYRIDIPRVKKRTTKRETKRRNITAKLGGLIEKLQEKNSNPDDPLFRRLNNSQPENDISSAMRRFVRDSNLRSPRTETLLHLTPRRCRTSLATHMAEEGASKFHIAEVLDHTDLQHVGVYTETVSSIADAVAEATDHEMRPLVDRFLGRIVDSLNPLQRSQMVPMQSPHVPLPILNTGGVGGCGRDPQKEGLCDLFPPLSCYLCPFFAALRSGPHREVLDSLESYLKQSEASTDPRILRQLDDIVTAIRTVLNRLGEGNTAATQVPN